MDLEVVSAYTAILAPPQVKVNDKQLGGVKAETQLSACFCFHQKQSLASSCLLTMLPLKYDPSPPSGEVSRVQMARHDSLFILGGVVNK